MRRVLELWMVGMIITACALQPMVATAQEQPADDAVDGFVEITPEARQAVEKGLAFLAASPSWATRPTTPPRRRCSTR